ncbi:hypothetical protein OIDMADRAFT_55602 [Oidiodendron maius Zn]|uniref:C2H2-type domain-containing protein n=1 Tax=Oidiodendron maius (strain Zn) TaxID=913774 RepID=A0A0C3DCN0_OIDMZ|nr:hypothetical protein OIDMADRAFT_55602 [Oidiodendron maius Zn]
MSYLHTACQTPLLANQGPLVWNLEIEGHTSRAIGRFPDPPANTPSTGTLPQQLYSKGPWETFVTLLVGGQKSAGLWHLMFRFTDSLLYPTTSRERVSLIQGDTILGDLYALRPTCAARKLLGNPPSCHGDHNLPSAVTPESRAGWRPLPDRAVGTGPRMFGSKEYRQADQRDEAISGNVFSTYCVVPLTQASVGTETPPDARPLSPYGFSTPKLIIATALHSSKAYGAPTTAALILPDGQLAALLIRRGLLQSLLAPLPAAKISTGWTLAGNCLAPGTPASGQLVPQTVSHPPAATRQSRGKRRAKRPREQTENEGSDHDSGDSEPKAPHKNKNTKKYDAQSFLACPFYKLDPRRYWRCYRKYELTDFNAVRQHIRRCHRLSEWRCPICWAVFPSEEEWVAHTRDNTCQQRSNEHDEFDEGELADLCRMHRGDTDEESWLHMWDRHFTGHPRPISVYVESSIAEPANILRGNAELQGIDTIVDVLQHRVPSLDLEAARDLTYELMPHFYNYQAMPQRSRRLPNQSVAAPSSQDAPDTLLSTVDPANLVGRAPTDPRMPPGGDPPFWTWLYAPDDGPSTFSAPENSDFLGDIAPAEASATEQLDLNFEAVYGEQPENRQAP